MQYLPALLYKALLKKNYHIEKFLYFKAFKEEMKERMSYFLIQRVEKLKKINYSEVAQSSLAAFHSSAMQRLLTL